MQFNYYELENYLGTLPVVMSVSECHGVLTGLAAAGKSINQHNWCEHILEDHAHYEHIKDADKETLAEWYALTAAQLGAADLSFTMCLPDDEQALKDRLNAVADWCHGFLYGLAATGDVDFKTLPAEASESLSDLGEIGKIDAVASIDDGEAESDLMEIIEYVRMAALSLYDDIQAQFTIHATTDFLDETVH